MKTGDKVKVNKDIPSINGMLREGTVVRVDEILLTKLEKDNIRVVDDVGKIWWVNSIDLKT
tara:strand:+ start:16 stop:198 length:183 start_codon:yes stop_codon:yes gene_type:complete